MRAMSEPRARPAGHAGRSAPDPHAPDPHAPGPGTHLPRFPVLQKALRAVTERLATEVGGHELSPPAWTELEWRLAPAVAGMHGVGPLLAASWRWGGPRSWTGFLEDQRRATLAREERIAELLRSLEQGATRAGVSLVLLKGAALRALGIYGPGERPMADIDLLARPEDLAAAARLLASLGYRDGGTTWKHRAFEAGGEAEARTLLGEHADNPLKIDLHDRIAERLPLTIYDFSDLVVPRERIAGLSVYPSTAALMLHVLAHAAGTMVHRGLRLIQLNDIARIAARMSAEHWRELTSCGESRLWWIAAPLALTERYFPAVVPQHTRALARHGPWPLRASCRRQALSDVSYSRVFIDPIPGLLWTRSPLEMASYVLSRIVPSREQRAQLALLSHTAPWSGEPQWYAQSQVRRILQWVSGRPTRIETTQPIRAALARAELGPRDASAPAG